MGITRKEADALESEFMSAMPEGQDYSRESAIKLLEAWNHLIEIMVREKDMTDKLGVESIDWQIGNWANDTVMAAHNAGLYEEEIRVNEQILQIRWSGRDNTFHENARRDIADAYADMGNVKECYRLYEKYLREDPLWGWAWIGYYRQLNDHDDARFESILDDLYQKAKAGVDFRDKEDLFRELGDEYNTLGNKERADYFYKLEDAQKRSRRSFFGEPGRSVSEIRSEKIYPNDLCPCGSGRKYKKCCGKK